MNNFVNQTDCWQIQFLLSSLWMMEAGVVTLFELPSLKSSLSHSHYLDQAVGAERVCFVLTIIYVKIVEYILADINIGCCTIWFAGGVIVCTQRDAFFNHHGSPTVFVVVFQRSELESCAGRSDLAN